MPSYRQTEKKKNIICLGVNKRADFIMNFFFVDKFKLDLKKNSSMLIGRKIVTVHFVIISLY